jgi:hypothetical protein
MLQQVLKEFEAAQGSISVSALSRKLGIEPSMLEAMLEFLVRQGSLQDSKQLIQQSEGSCSSGSCGKSCHGPQKCSFVANMPRTFTLTAKGKN